MGNKANGMKLKEILKVGGLVDKVIGIVDKTIVDKGKASELKMELIKLIAANQSPITRYVRAVIAIMFMVVWLFFPENFAGREDTTRYVLYGIVGFYFLADFTIDKWKRK